MRKVFFLLILTLGCLSFRAAGQEDTLRCTYTPYPFPEIRDTPAPRGYKPFYISSYNRHGSRYMGKESEVSCILDALEAAREANALTAEGSALLKDMRSFAALSEGMYGQLAPRGERELSALGARTARRFKEVFKGGTRTEVNGVSSTANRCVVSMANYLTALKDACPKMNIHYTTGERHFRYISNAWGISRVRAVHAKALDRHIRSRFDYPSLAERLFTDGGKAAGAVTEWTSFCMYLYYCAADTKCLDSDLDLFRYLTPDQILTLRNQADIVRYSANCLCLGTAAMRMDMVTPSMHEIRDKCAQALRPGSTLAATFRFGHDTSLMALFSYLGLEGYTLELEPAQVPGRWHSWELMPMGSNLQMVFYGKKKGQGDVLVKFLLNEEEKAIPELGEGPYYKWSDVCRYLDAREQRFAAGAKRATSSSGTR